MAELSGLQPRTPVRNVRIDVGTAKRQTEAGAGVNPQETAHVPQHRPDERGRPLPNVLTALNQQKQPAMNATSSTTGGALGVAEPVRPKITREVRNRDNTTLLKPTNRRRLPNDLVGQGLQKGEPVLLPSSTLSSVAKVRTTRFTEAI